MKFVYNNKFRNQTNIEMPNTSDEKVLQIS